MNRLTRWAVGNKVGVALATTVALGLGAASVFGPFWGQNGGSLLACLFLWSLLAFGMTTAGMALILRYSQKKKFRDLELLIIAMASFVVLVAPS
jgi:hypothetical protein